jgi:hypothetical protein
MSVRRNGAPGFTAEAVLSQTTRHYRTAGTSFDAGRSNAVVPQLAIGTGVGGLGGLGGIFTDFGCYWSYSFCLLGCAFEWVKWEGIDTGVASALAQKCVADCEVDLLRCKGGLPPEPGIP